MYLHVSNNEDDSDTDWNMLKIYWMIFKTGIYTKAIPSQVRYAVLQWVNLRIDYTWLKYLPHEHRIFTQESEVLQEKVLTTSLLVFFFINFFSQITMYSPNASKMRPWPASPNIMANRNGKVMIVYSAVTDSKDMLHIFIICHVPDD